MSRNLLRKTKREKVQTLLYQTLNFAHVVEGLVATRSLDDPSGTYCLIKYGLYVIPSGFEVKGFPHPPLRKSFVCDDSRNTIYAKHNIICRKATSFSDRKRKRYLRLWRKMVFLPAVGNTTLRVVVPLPPREG